MPGWDGIGMGITKAAAGGLWARPAAIVAEDPAVIRKAQLALLAASVFLFGFQSYAVPPLLPLLASEFAVPATGVGLLVPAFAFPYGVVALGYGPLSDRLGRRRVVGGCLWGLAVALVGTGVAPSLGWLLVSRVAAGLTAGGIMPVALAFIADLYPYQERGRAIGALYGALTVGMAAGFSLAPALVAWTGWRALFIGFAAVAGGVLVLIGCTPAPSAKLRPLLPVGGYRAVLGAQGAGRVYGIMLLAGVCVFGVNAWFGTYVHARYGLGQAAIGLAYLAYGVVGGLGPLLGALADRLGRASLVPAGLAAVGFGALLLALQGPLALAILGLAGVALGHQLTTPLLAGLASELVPHARGRAMGLNTFVLFMGVGGGSCVVGRLIPAGFGAAFGSIALIAAVAAVVATGCLRGER